jgi:predicted porin
MNKKLIALAVAGAVFAPAALAQTPANAVTVYGLVDMTLENVKADAGPAAGSSISSRNRVTSQASRLGVRGTEDLGDGLKAFFQLESQVNPDDACGQGGNPNPGTLPNGGCSITGNGGKALASRNSAVGLQGGFGSILLGRWDTPYKLASLSVDPWGDVTIGGYVTVMHDKGNFDRRENNAVQFWTAKYSGFEMRLHYSANEAKATANPSTASLSATYAMDAFSVAYAYEKHSDQNGGAALVNTTETGNELAATYKMGPIKLGLATEKIKKTNLTDKKAWFLSGEYTMGKATVALSYGESKDGAASTAVTQPNTKSTVLGVKYALSGRTTAYGLYSQVKNNNAGNNDFGLNGITPATGGDPKGFGVGIKHTF